MLQWTEVLHRTLDRVKVRLNYAAMDRSIAPHIGQNEGYIKLVQWTEVLHCKLDRVRVRLNYGAVDRSIAPHIGKS